SEAAPSAPKAPAPQHPPAPAPPTNPAPSANRPDHHPPPRLRSGSQATGVLPVADIPLARPAAPTARHSPRSPFPAFAPEASHCRTAPLPLDLPPEPPVHTRYRSATRQLRRRAAASSLVQ